jgi:hypothetical protein
MLSDTGRVPATVRSALAISVIVSIDKIMNKLQQLSHDVAWEHPYPVKNQIWKYLVKEGANLPNSLTEDLSGFSLCPTYSNEQLRRIMRLKIRKLNYGHGGGNVKALERRQRKLMQVRKALAEEGLLR